MRHPRNPTVTYNWKEGIIVSQSNAHNHHLSRVWISFIFVSNCCAVVFNLLAGEYSMVCARSFRISVSNKMQKWIYRCLSYLGKIANNSSKHLLLGIHQSQEQRTTIANEREASAPIRSTIKKEANEILAYNFQINLNNSRIESVSLECLILYWDTVHITHHSIT